MNRSELTPRRVLLALDTSTRSAGLALYDGDQVLCETTWTSHDHHTAELAPAIADAFNKTGVSAGQLAAVAVAMGPGSFTGLRIGLALAKGLVLAHAIPLIGIPTLDIVAAAQAVLVESLAAVLRAGRGRLAVGWYQRTETGWHGVQPVEVLTPEELASRIQSPTQVCGELTKRSGFCSVRITNRFTWPPRQHPYAGLLIWQNWPGSAGKRGRATIQHLSPRSICTTTSLCPDDRKDPRPP